MKKFMDENFLLSNDTAIRLYHEYAKEMPIYDYHCHLNPKEIWENKKYENITEVWLGGDHYKWRAMRSDGVDEKYITGNATDKEKFMHWAKVLQSAIGNPLYHWAHLELQRFFGINEVLNEKTAEDIWNKTNEMLKGKGFGARDLIEKSKVNYICTTDDPVDNLEYHIYIKDENKMKTKVLPSFRPDKAVNITADTFLPWIQKLAEVVGRPIETYDDLLNALDERIAFFHNVGCRLSDHAFEYVPFEVTSENEVAAIFKKALNKEELSRVEADKYKTNLMQFLAKKFSALDWTMQLHMGAMRNNNKRMFDLLGPDTGFDSSHDYRLAAPLAKFLSSLDETNELPRTILYTLNPKDNYVLGTLMGCFQGGEPGKIQYGSGWWFLDQKTGITEQLTTLGNLGLLSRFVGMLTDSRSFLSYPRHEYFRRILCDLIGTWVENGEFPQDMELLGELVQNISYNNAENYFKM